MVEAYKPKTYNILNKIYETNMYEKNKIHADIIYF